MELAHGKNITTRKADELGVLSAVEGFVRDNSDSPWEALVPADLPVDQTAGAVTGENMSKGHDVSLYRAMHHLKKGGLHRALGIAEGQTIPADRLAAAKNSTNEHVRHMANFASTMEHFKHS